MDSQRIRILPPETAKRIAAGEVIDRPAAALRELLDNAVDSGATDIRVDIQGGGIDLIRVSDNGSGMGRDDLVLSVHPHATSKIRELDDLLSLRTLGFRGEALASMAAVAELELVSAPHDNEAWRLSSVPGKEPTIEPWRGAVGTTVTVSGLFASFPARRQFLKSPAAEAAVCRQVFVDKILPWPDRAFRLGGKNPLVFLPDTLAGRVLAAHAGDQPPELFRELAASGRGFSARVVAGAPDIYRSDRRMLQIFINGRRVQEYGLAQALEYAYRGALPGGAWPFAFAFIDVDPSLADFNIHPAKKEVRLKNVDDIRAGLMDAVRSWLGSTTRSSSVALLRDKAWGGTPGQEGRSDTGMRPPVQAYGLGLEAPAPQARDERWMDELARKVEEARERPPEDRRPLPAGDARFRYLGQALGVFLVAEMDGELLILDQHAAHERVIYDELMSGTARRQELLVPVVYEPESADEDRYLRERAAELDRLGFRIRDEGGTWLLETAPAILPESRTGAIFEVLKRRPDPDALVRETAARAACRSAIMDGEALDPASAQALLSRALDLPDPHCPHGRPIWLRLSRDDLYRAVRRIV